MCFHLWISLCVCMFLQLWSKCRMCSTFFVLVSAACAPIARFAMYPIRSGSHWVCLSESRINSQSICVLRHCQNLSVGDAFVVRFIFSFIFLSFLHSSQAIFMAHGARIAFVCVEGAREICIHCGVCVQSQRASERKAFWLWCVDAFCCWCMRLLFSRRKKSLNPAKNICDEKSPKAHGHYDNVNWEKKREKNRRKNV